MNRTELFTEVKSWLEAGKISFTSDDEGVVSLVINGDHGMLNLRVLCEEDPPMLQVFAPMPLRLARQKVGDAACLLHNLNTTLRIGSFHLHAEERLIVFRLTMPIRPDGELAEQFSQSIGATVSTMDDHLYPLGLLACATPEAQKAVAKLKPRRESQKAAARLPSRSRFEVN